jgi:hypothetical protein
MKGFSFVALHQQQTGRRNPGSPNEVNIQAILRWKKYKLRIKSHIPRQYSDGRQVQEREGGPRPSGRRKDWQAGGQAGDWKLTSGRMIYAPLTQLNLGSSVLEIWKSHKGQ